MGAQGLSLAQGQDLEPRLREFVRRCLTDTGYLCRNLLGWNFDIDFQTQKRIRQGTGGIRNHGSHQQVVEFVDDQERRLKLILTPRDSYKSTIAQGRVVREILSDPDTVIFYGMKTDGQVKKKSIAIRNTIEFNPRIRAIWGDLVGSPWDASSWTVRNRRNPSIQDPTFSTFSMDSPPTGGHPKLIVLDDPIDWENCWTKESIEKSKWAIDALTPLYRPDTQVLVFGTYWDEDDIYHSLELMAPTWHTLKIDAGFELVKDEHGNYDLLGEPKFEHLDKAFLMHAFESMRRNEVLFSSQYLLRTMPPTKQLFKRHHFKSVKFERSMKDLSGWLLCDTASSTEADACMSVVAYVGLDSNRRAYLLDLRCGRMPPNELVATWFEVYERWTRIVNHRGETLENVPATAMFHGYLEEMARLRGVRLNIQTMPRTGVELRKKQRIRNLQYRFERDGLYVVSTVPRTYHDQGKEKLLWDPEGFQEEATGLPLPAGELVDQFIRFDRHPLMDIPDTLADIDQKGKDERLVCTYREPRNSQSSYGLPKTRKRGYPPGPRQQTPAASDGWWDRACSMHGI